MNKKFFRLSPNEYVEIFYQGKTDWDKLCIFGTVDFKEKNITFVFADMSYVSVIFEYFEPTSFDNLYLTDCGQTFGIDDKEISIENIIKQGVRFT